MGKLLIKKRIGLDFIGEEYKDSYILFNSIPLRDYEKYMTENEEIQKKGNNIGSVKLLIKVLKDKFIEGKVPGGALTADDLEDLDVDAAIKLFALLTGQEQPPKA